MISLNDASLRQRLTIFQLLDPTVDLAALSDQVPKGPADIATLWAMTNVEPWTNSCTVPLRKRCRLPSCSRAPTRLLQNLRLASWLLVQPNSDALAKPDVNKRKRIVTDVRLCAWNMAEFVGVVVLRVQATVLSLRVDLPNHEVVDKTVVQQGAKSFQNSVSFSLPQ